MKILIPALLLLGLLSACQSTSHTAPTASQARWTTSGTFDEKPFGGYVVRNNIWGEGHGSQQLWANSAADWGVHADHPDTSGIKAYPHAGWMVDRRLSRLAKVTSRFAVAVPKAGSYNTAYDIWCEKHAYEIMLWVNWHGKMGPIASSWDATGTPKIEMANVSVGGHTWDVYKGSNGVNAVFSFLCTSQQTSGEVDVKAVLDWIKAQGWFAQPGDVLLDEVQFGWEIAGSPGGLNFSVTDFAVEVE